VRAPLLALAAISILQTPAPSTYRPIISPPGKGKNRDKVKAARKQKRNQK